MEQSMSKFIKKGDFSTLAENYAKYRPRYSTSVIDAIFGTFQKPINEIVAADIGAGTGIFTKMIHKKGVKAVYAIEPNDAMRQEGMRVSADNILWKTGSAEGSGLHTKSIDFVSMASSFHWPDTKKALAEFDRILKDTGLFTAIWNPRITELSEIESEIDILLSKEFDVQKRVSSGRSGITNEIHEIISNSGYFSKQLYCEAVDRVEVPSANYVGAWKSVNDIQSQLGEEKFSKFIRKIEQILIGVSFVDVHYQTRAWVASR